MFIIIFIFVYWDLQGNGLLLKVPCYFRTSWQPVPTGPIPNCEFSVWRMLRKWSKVNRKGSFATYAIHIMFRQYHFFNKLPQNSMRLLLRKFRIPVSDVVVIPDMTYPPSNQTKTWFDVLTNEFVRRDDEPVDSESTGLQFFHLFPIVLWFHQIHFYETERNATKVGYSTDRAVTRG